MKDNKAVQALFNIQKKLYEEGEFFTKKGKNIHFKSKYLQLPDLLAKVVPLLHREGCSLLQGTRHSDNPDIAIVTTTIVHIESGDSYLNETDLPVAKLSPQEMGKAVTYGRRYGLEPMFGIPTIDDDGEEAETQTREPPPKAKTVDPYKYLSSQTGLPVEKIKERLGSIGINTEQKIRSAGSEMLIKMLKEKPGE